MITEFKIFEDLITPEESYSAFVNLKKYTYQKNVYIHFTNINKLGMNPQKDHHDPYGIYFYPANFVFGEGDTDGINIGTHLVKGEGNRNSVASQTEHPADAN